MKAVQVKFFDGETWQGGIMIDDEYIVCGCCGGIFEVEEVAPDIIIYKNWVNISFDIL